MCRRTIRGRLARRRRAGLEVAFDLPSPVEVFAGSDGNGSAAAHGGEGLDLFGVGCFFDPAGVVFLDLFGPLQSVGLVPSTVSVEHEFGVVAESFAQDADEIDVLAHAFGARAGAIGHEPFLIAIAFALDGEGAGANGFRLERKAEATGVHLDGGARGATEQAIDGNVEETAADVPQGVVDGADGHHEETVARVAVGAVHLVPEFFAGECVFAEEKGA